MNEFINGLSREELEILSKIIEERTQEVEYVHDAFEIAVGKEVIHVILVDGLPYYHLQDTLGLLGAVCFVDPTTCINLKEGFYKGLYVPLEWLFNNRDLKNPLQHHSEVRYSLLQFYVDCLERKLL